MTLNPFQISKLNSNSYNNNKKKTIFKLGKSMDNENSLTDLYLWIRLYNAWIYFPKSANNTLEHFMQGTHQLSSKLSLQTKGDVPHLPSLRVFEYLMVTFVLSNAL